MFLRPSFKYIGKLDKRIIPISTTESQEYSSFAAAWKTTVGGGEIKTRADYTKKEKISKLASLSNKDIGNKKDLSELDLHIKANKQPYTNIRLVLKIMKKTALQLTVSCRVSSWRIRPAKRAPPQAMRERQVRLPNGPGQDLPYVASSI
jgi:hypothetical protein